MSEIESESEKMLDVTFYRDAVLEIVLSEKHIAREVYELRLTLFLRAASVYFNQMHKVLEPFPSCFFDRITKSRRYDELKLCLSGMPNIREINVRFNVTLAKRITRRIFCNAGNHLTT